MLADQLTPVSAFSRLAEDSDHAFLLESVVGGEQIARYSFVATHPTMVFRARRDTAWIERHDGVIEELSEVSDPLEALRTLLDDFQAVSHEMLNSGLASLPRFTGGAVGYASYDTMRYYEKMPEGPEDDRGVDDLAFGIYDGMVVFDHLFDR